MPANIARTHREARAVTAAPHFLAIEDIMELRNNDRRAAITPNTMALGRRALPAVALMHEVATQNIGL